MKILPSDWLVEKVPENFSKTTIIHFQIIFRSFQLYPIQVQTQKMIIQNHLEAQIQHITNPNTPTLQYHMFHTNSIIIPLIHVSIFKGSALT